MESRKLQSCFISAPVGVDIAPLREALAERGVKSWDATSIVLPGARFSRTIEDAIADADFLCAVIPAGPVASNVYFELGVAAGKNLPRLLFVAPKADLPAALREQPYARTTLDNTGALRFHLDAFLKNAGKPSARRAMGQRSEPANLNLALIDNALDQMAAWEVQGWPPDKQELVKLLADIFDASGYITSTAPALSGQNQLRPDMAVWIDELQTTIGNPLLIEVVVNSASMPSAIRQMQSMLATTQTTLGLVINWHLEPAEQPKDWVQPFIVVMGAQELVKAIRQGELARELLVRRNTVVHSAA